MCVYGALLSVAAKLLRNCNDSELRYWHFYHFLNELHTELRNLIKLDAMWISNSTHINATLALGISHTKHTYDIPEYSASNLNKRWTFRSKLQKKNNEWKDSASYQIRTFQWCDDKLIRYTFKWIESHGNSRMHVRRKPVGRWHHFWKGFPIKNIWLANYT